MDTSIDKIGAMIGIERLEGETDKDYEGRIFEFAKRHNERIEEQRLEDERGIRKYVNRQE